jgi:mono/diheme cytochrome c family protein
MNGASLQKGLSTFAKLLWCCVLTITCELAEALPFNQDMVNTQYSNGTIMRPAPEGAVSVAEANRWVGKKREDALALTNTVPPSVESVSKGKRLYHINCSPCHGRMLEGEYVPGAVSQQVPGPNLFMAFYKDRPDNHFFQFIYFGGMAIMPAYGWKFSIEEHWDIVNYIRSVQSVSTNPDKAQ